MKNNKRYLLSQWLLLPILSCSLLMLNPVQANEDGIDDAPLTLEDDNAVGGSGEDETASPLATAENDEQSEGGEKGAVSEVGLSAASADIADDEKSESTDSALPTPVAQAKALSQDSDGILNESTATAGGSVSYMGGNTRIGVGVDSKYKMRVDATQVLLDSKDAVTSGEGWLGVNPAAKEGEEKLTGAGLKVNHHWVENNDTGGVDRVHKVFGAYDQNEKSDKKVTAGYGQETQSLFWSGHASFAKGEDRVLGTTATGDPLLERAYDYGVGGRVGTFLPGQLMQLQGGVDVELGKTFAEGEKRPAQVTFTGGVEKFFADSPHSIGANLELLNKMGGVEEEKKTDARGNLSYRYEFGGAGLYEPNQTFKRVKVEIPGEVKVVHTPPKVERKMIKNTMELEGDTFFERGQAVLLPEAQQRLEGIVARMRGGGIEGKIHIVGNTCDLGADDSNLALSEARADAVREFLVQKGFNPDDLLAEGMGEASPKYPNDEDNRHRNRRVDIEYMTYQTDYKEIVVDEGSTQELRSAPKITWRQEVVNTPPKWVERALRNTIQHKRSIDTYRTGGTVNTAEEGTAIIARSDTYLFYSDVIGTSQVLDILKNDHFVAGTKIKLVDNPNGLELIVGAETITYIPRAASDYSFTYKLIGPDGKESELTTVIIKVSSCQNAATCSNMALANDPFGIALNDVTTKTIDVLGNDSGDELTIISVSTPKYGTATISPDGKSILYTLRYGYCASHEFTYTVKDKQGKTGQATVLINIQG